MLHNLSTILPAIAHVAASCMLAAAPCALASEFHVAVSGNDSADGSAAHPLKTISAAAQKAMPGDTVTVHAGTYREWVKPPRGGNSEQNRITYAAAKGEAVVITGSEAPTGWKKISEGVWELTLPNTFFKEANPFDEQIYGSWYLSYGKPVLTGNVFLDGKPLPEAFDAGTPFRPGAQAVWYAKADGNGGPVLMNFEWVRPVGGKAMNSTQAAVEKGDQAIYKSATEFPYGYLKDGAVMHFDGLDFGAGTNTVEFQAATLAKGGTVEFRLGATDGELLGAAEVTNTGDWEKYAVFKVKLARKLSGKQNIRIVLKAPALKVDGVTVITAKFPTEIDPNSGRVEIAARPAVFFPATTGKDYITVRGFVLENAATNWASPSAFQPGLIGPRWSKGWIIEDNEIRNSRCSCVSLGRPTFGHTHHYQTLQVKVYPEAGGGQTEKQLVDYFKNASWTKNEAGFHLVRNNRIHDCGQAGIVGTSGSAFSVIEGNDIADIHRGQPFTGAETAGIKLHFAIDTVIRDNRIHRTNRGIWLDWGPQNAQVVGNLLYDNGGSGYAESDVFVEVAHGPALFANNIFLSSQSLVVASDGLAMAHNLVVGSFSGQGDKRHTYVYRPHDTVSVGKPAVAGGDWRWYNNILASGIDPDWRGGLPVTTSGNIFMGKGLATTPKADDSALDLPDTTAPKLVHKDDGDYLVFDTDESWRAARSRKLVTTQLLGKAVAPKQAFENADGSALRIDTDYFGKKRDASNPFPGPFEVPVSGEVRVWPKQ